MIKIKLKTINEKSYMKRGDESEHTKPMHSMIQEDSFSTCKRCGAPNFLHSMNDDYGAARGPEDANDDGELSGCELKYHFDLNGDGIVTPDEYAAHIMWHMKHPESLKNMIKDYVKVQSGKDLSDYEGSMEEVNLDDMDLNEGKKDRCYKLAKKKYKVFPSAYASGFIVRCRKGKVAKKKKKNENLSEQQVQEIISEILQEGTFDKEKSKGLHGWFARQGGKGKSKGWVDCNTCRTNPKTGRKTCKTCGRQSGEKRSKYPACRPTPSACTRTGTSKKRGPMRVSWKKKKK